MVAMGLVRKQQYAWQATSMALRIARISVTTHWDSDQTARSARADQTAFSSPRN
jgi:hypothetical protein